jgi:hypothetical protein
MYEPKKDIYTILSNRVIDDATVYQTRPEVLKEFPCITFSIAENTPEYTLEKEIGYQEIVVAIDIYAKTSIESGSLLATLVEDMISEGYRMTFCSDIPDPDGYSHITTRFNLVA